MRLRIVRCKVRYETHVSMALRNQYEPIVSVFLGRGQAPSNRDAEFQGHVEPGQVLVALASAARQIVDRVPGGKDRPSNPIDPRFGDVTRLHRTSREEATARRREHYGIKKRLKLRIKGAVDEH